VLGVRVFIGSCHTSVAWLHGVPDPLEWLVYEPGDRLSWTAVVMVQLNFSFLLSFAGGKVRGLFSPYTGSTRFGLPLTRIGFWFTLCLAPGWSADPVILIGNVQKTPQFSTLRRRGFYASLTRRSSAEFVERRQHCCLCQGMFCSGTCHGSADRVYVRLPDGAFRDYHMRAYA